MTTNNSTQLIVKFSQDVRNVNVSFTDVLIDGELFSSGVVGSSTPAGLACGVVGQTGTGITLEVGTGTHGQSYGIPVTFNSDLGHVYTKVLAVVVDDNIAGSYQNQNDVAFNAIVGKLDAGTSGLGKANFMFPPGFAANTGTVEWTLLDKEGLVYGSGQAFDYQYNTVQSGTKVEAQAVIGCPSNMVPTLQGQIYQIRWTLTVNGQQYHMFEGLEVTSTLTVPEGVEDIVEMEGTEEMSVFIVLPEPWDKVTVDVYKRNTKMVSSVPAIPMETPDGWQYSVLLTGLRMPADLEAYILVWSMVNQARPTYIERQTGRLFIVNPTLVQATNDMRILINKAHTSILSTTDMLFTVPLLLAYLRRGRDMFNIAWGMFTGFTMINASGGIREMWLKFSEIYALRAQFLAEGEKVFNFSGQAISLDVDRTQYYDSLANSIQAELDNQGKEIKQNLIKKGIIGGDGNVDNLQMGVPGHTGMVGITLSPATNWTRYGGRFGGGIGRLF
jgi:hypothetical protein